LIWQPLKSYVSPLLKIHWKSMSDQPQQIQLTDPARKLKFALKVFIAVIGWFAVIAQYYLMLKNSTLPEGETTIRFFSYFTILTNVLVASFFTQQLFSQREEPDFTAIVVYIFVVGAIYQVILRPLWSPSGLQKIVDELLHSFVPVAVFCYWYFFQVKSTAYGKIKYWLIYPVIYLVFVLIRGNSSGFYPYPFVDLKAHSGSDVVRNCILVALLFMSVSFLFVFLKKIRSKHQLSR
jgi:hypothetical protein